MTLPSIRRQTRRQRRRAALLTDDEVIGHLHEFISALMIPEADRLLVYRSVERFLGEPHPEGHYDLHGVAVCWMRAARVLWPDWPPQDSRGTQGNPEPNMTPGTVAPASAPGAAYRFPAPGRGSS